MCARPNAWDLLHWSETQENERVADVNIVESAAAAPNLLSFRSTGGMPCAGASAGYPSCTSPVSKIQETGNGRGAIGCARATPHIAQTAFPVYRRIPCVCGRQTRRPPRPAPSAATRGATAVLPAQQGPASEIQETQRDSCREPRRDGAQHCGSPEFPTWVRNALADEGAEPASRSSEWGEHVEPGSGDHRDGQLAGRSDGRNPPEAADDARLSSAK